MYFNRKKYFLMTLLVIVLFLIGRFYLEVESFFDTPYSIIGLLSSVCLLLVYYIQYQKIKLEQAWRTSDKHYNDCELYRIEIRSLENKLKNKK